MTQTSSLPGYPLYTINAEGQVFYQGQQKKTLVTKGKVLMIRLRANGHARDLSLARLVAQCFVPNPQQHPRIRFKDGDPSHCSAANLEWVSGRKEELPVEKRATAPHAAASRAPLGKLPANPAAKPIPGFTGYYASPDGQIYHGSYPLQPWYGKACRLAGTDAHRRYAPLVRVTSDAGKQNRRKIADLVALCFVPNPQQLPYLVCKDGNKSNCRVDNLQWVNAASNGLSYRRLWPGDLPAAWIDPERVPIEGFPGYSISPAGRVYQGDRLLSVRQKRSDVPLVVLRQTDSPIKKLRYMSLGRLVAQHFVPNPKEHDHIIFKDRNNLHCHAANIAWVDGQTFAYYAGLKRGGSQKKQGDPETAIRRCCSPWLRSFYQTQEVHWLHRCWQEIDRRLQGHPLWRELQGEVYLYFFDRAQRFSILGEPRGLVIKYMQALFLKSKKETNPEIPYRLLMQSDESLRNRHSDY